MDIESDGNLFLNEEFMNQIFSTIYIDKAGNPAPLESLEDAMWYQYEDRQTQVVESSKEVTKWSPSTSSDYMTSNAFLSISVSKLAHYGGKGIQLQGRSNFEC